MILETRSRTVTIIPIKHPTRRSIAIKELPQIKPKELFQIVTNVLTLASRHQRGISIHERTGTSLARRHFFLHPHNPLVFHLIEEANNPPGHQLLFNIVRQPALRSVLEAKAAGSLRTYQELLIPFMEPSRTG